MYALASLIALWFQACVRAFADNSAQVDRKGIEALCFFGGAAAPPHPPARE